MKTVLLFKHQMFPQTFHAIFRGRASWGNPQRFEELVKLTMGELILIDTKITKA